MLYFLIVFFIHELISNIPFGYEEVPMTDLERRGYDPTNLDDVNEYYEQKQSGYFDL